ncbi:MAG TPA: RNA-binding cell elongation regulator Jag/EloR [Acidimicrobiales bacterium]|nr:RNA-binding cell elongation regulator Jag/EloR [Acidimicrobiales bacterium]
MEASGKSLAEAKETVLDLLGVAEDDAEFVVLSEPKAGLFGRMRGEARVQARVRPVAPPPKRTRRQRPDKKREGGERSRSGGSGRKNGSGRGDRGTEDAQGARAGSGGAEARTGSGEPAEAAGASSAGRSNRRRRSGSGNGNGSQDGRSSSQQGKQESGRKSGESEDSMEESLTLDQQGEAAQEFLAGLIGEFGLDATVSFAEVDEDTVQVAAIGDDLGLLVGPRGATLAAVQDLTRTFVQRQSENRTDRILVDVGGYREKRTAALRRFTEGIVEEVKGSGSERALEPMSPADRKVIHDTVNEIEGVETRSEGVEPSRYVVIQPVG